MITGATGGQDEAFRLAELLAIEIQAAEMGAGIAIGEPPAHGILERLRLLVDLLEHVMLEIALVRISGVPVDQVHTGIDAAAVLVEDLPGVGRQHAHLVVLQVNHLLGVIDQRHRVAGQEMFVLPDTQHQRTA